MKLPNVRNVNKGKRKKKKHHYKVGDFVAVKWIGEKQLAIITELTWSKEKNPTYKVNSVSYVGCIYSGLELDDPEDPYCYVSSTLTKSLTDGEIRRIEKYLETQDRLRNPTKYSEVKSQPVRTSHKRNSDLNGLEEAIAKQKAFVNGEKFW